MTRLEEIIGAVTEELRRCAADVNVRENIRAVTISIKLAPGMTRPRAVICQIESETRWLTPPRRP